MPIAWKLGYEGLLDVVGIAGFNDVPQQLSLLSLTVETTTVVSATARRIKGHSFYLQSYHRAL